LITRNPSITGWGINRKSFDELIELAYEDKSFQNDTIRVAFQTPINITVNGETGEALSSTFEDALTYANINTILKSSEDYASFVTSDVSITELCQRVYEHVHKGEKVSLAMGMMYSIENIITPQYIVEGLSWLNDKLTDIEE